MQSDPLILKTLSNTSDTNNPQSRFSQPYFLDMETCETLVLQTIPMELNHDTGMLWVVISSPGRNNPLYQYTGAEDTLNFTLTWYANEQSREDVLRNCKWLESVGKNDGYDNKPHRLKFMFGKLFNDAIWIMFSCQYKTSMFNRIMGMLPCLAVQEITLKRVMTTNRTMAQIRKIDT